MRLIKSFLALVINFASFFSIQAQNIVTDSSKINLTQITDNQEDSTNIYSNLVFNVGYANRVIYAGRDFRVKQFGLNGGLNYYHKSGLFLGVNSTWQSEAEPQYVLTDFGVGYSFDIVKNWLLNLSYDYLLFNNPENQPINPLQHNLGLSTNYDFGPIYLGVDYGFLTGGEQAHRVNAYVGGYIPIYKVWIFDKISFSPNFNAFWGTDNITLSQLPNRLLTRLQQSGNLSRLDTDKFGLMNLQLSLPVQLKIERVKFNFTYHFAFPQKLFEVRDRYLQNTSYFSTSLSFTLGKI
jgi:hypothetical protein